MSMTPARHRRRSFDIWPGFVDALTSLILVMLFVMLIFSIGQFVLSDTLASKNRVLDALNSRIADLAKQLSLSEGSKRALDARVTELAASLGEIQTERDRYKKSLDAETARVASLRADIAALMELKRQLEADAARLSTRLDTSTRELARQTEMTSAATAQIELLNRQLSAIGEQLRTLQSLLDAAKQELRAKDVKIADLGKQLNLALASRVSELERYRSEFFGKLREALDKREDVRIVGDRFVLPADILFDSGSADLGDAAEARLSRILSTLREVGPKIPPTVNWVLRIDGHTDRVPIHTDRFPSNWELSTARALAIVKYFVTHGVPPNRLSANGFGEFQPMNAGNTPSAYAKNRRIELQLTNR